MEIREATADDAALILNFITELAIYEKAEHEVEATEATIRDSLFKKGTTTHGVICSLEGKPVGFAVYFFNYSTWLAKPGLYLEDLYILPKHRGSGAGKALLKHLAGWLLPRAAVVLNGLYWIGINRQSVFMSHWAHGRKTSGRCTG